MDDTLIHLDVDWREVRDEMAGHLAKSGKEIDYGIAGSILDSEGEEKDKLLEIQEAYEERGWRTAVLMPNAREVLESLKGKYLLGLVTGNGRKCAEKALERMGLAEYFETVKTREDGMKPLPNGIIDALADLRCDASDAVFVGNGKSDMLAARAAGVMPIGITNTYSAEELKKMGAEKTINDLSELEALL